MFTLKAKPRARIFGGDCYVRMDISTKDKLNIVSEYRIVICISGSLITKFLIIQIRPVQWSAYWADSIIFDYLKLSGYDLYGVKGITVSPDNYTLWCYYIEYSQEGYSCGGNVTSLLATIEQFSGNREFLFSEIKWIQEYL